jgi:hypothetical protein
MHRMTVLLFCAALSVPTAGYAQSTAAQIEQALAAAPERAREGAAVIKWKADHTYETLKEGTNSWVCYDRSEYLARSPFAVQCTSEGNLERVAQNRHFRAESTDREEERATLADAEKNGARLAPEYGSIFISMEGPDLAGASIHITIAVPFATGSSTGLPENGRGGGAWIMAAGTSTAHIMTPGH